MARSAAIVLEVRTTGADTNGGGFKAGASGTDWSQQNAAQYSVTDAVTNLTTTITSATANFGTDVVGNLLYITGGDGFIAADWYEIISRTSATAIVVDRSTGLTEGIGATLKIGGALLTPTKAINTVMVGGNTCHIKAGTYTQTVALSPPTGTVAAPTIIRGYNATRGDLDNATAFTNDPILRMNNATAQVLTPAGSYVHAYNLVLDGGSGVSKADRCYTASGSGSIVERVKGINFVTYGFVGGAVIKRCQATSNIAGATAGFLNNTSPTLYEACVANALTCVPFSSNGGAPVYSGCLSISNTGATTDGFFDSHASTSATYLSCVSYGNGRDGIRLNGSANGDKVCICGCILESNLGYGIRHASLTLTDNVVDYNFFFNNTSGARLGFPTGAHDVNYTATAFTNAAGNDFSLNNTAGGGASIRAASYPGAIIALSTTGYRDGGPIQHADPASSGGVVVPIFNHGQTGVLAA